MERLPVRQKRLPGADRSNKKASRDETNVGFQDGSGARYAIPAYRYFVPPLLSPGERAQAIEPKSTLRTN
jgi:hypothetical protein